MGFGTNLFLLVIFLVVVGVFWSQISTGLSALQIDAKKKATEVLEKQEAESRIILPKVGDQVCELQFTVGGYFEYALKDLVKIPTPTTAYITGNSVSYKWVNCVKYGGTTMELLALTAGDPWNPLSILPVSGTALLQVELVGADGKYLNPKNVPALEKTITVDNVQTPINFAKTFYVTKLPRQDYTANIVFDGGSINEQPLGAPYIYKILK